MTATTTDPTAGTDPAGYRPAPLRAVLAAEVLKVRRARVLVLTTFLAATAPAPVGALFMVIAADPERARRAGLLGQKAELSGITADWPGLLAFLGQVVAVGTLLLFAFVTTWVFGREAQDGTLRYLLAVPVPRATVVVAKLAVVVVWCAALVGWLALASVAAGALLGLPGGGVAVLADGLTGVAVAGRLMLLVVPAPVAAVASAGRGYLVPLASAVGALVVAQIAAALGFATAVPWSVPAVAAGLAPGTGLGPGGILVAVGTGAAGVAATLAWWRSGRAGA